MTTEVQVMKEENGKIFFSKEFLTEDIMEGSTVVSTEMVDTSRWSIHYEMVFPFQGKFYRSHYSVGATECQDESPYEYEGDWVECWEVHQVEKTIKVWENVKK